MNSSEFTCIRSSKKLNSNDFLFEWQNFYENYESEIFPPFHQKEGPHFLNPKLTEKASFKKIKRSKTVDMGAFLGSLNEIYEENEDENNKKNNFQDKVKAKCYFDDIFNLIDNLIIFISIRLD